MFQAIFLRYPYDNQILEDDSLYQYIFNKDYDGFWKAKPDIFQMLKYWKGKDDSELSMLLDLLTRMLIADPNDRISMKEVCEHSWFTG